MTLNSPDILLYTILFIVPGFVFHNVVSSFVPRKEEKVERLFLRYLLFGAFNYALWFPILKCANTSGVLRNQPFPVVALWVATIFIGPCAIGVITGFCEQRDFVRLALQKLRLNPIHATPTAWDYRFSKSPPVWIQVCLKDGKSVRGVFGGHSFASSDPDERDLYIEQTYTVAVDGKWHAGPRNSAVLIKADQIAYVEFFADEGGRHECAT